MAKKVSELKPTDEVVVTLAAKTQARGGKMVEVEAEREVVMTKAGYDLIDQDDDGYAPALQREVSLKGTPKYKKESESLAGTHREMDSVEPFTSEKPAEPAQ